MLEKSNIATSGSRNINDQHLVSEIFIERSEVIPALDTYDVIFLDGDAMWPRL